MPPKQKTIYCCSECGNETANWAGKCPSCGAWNTLTELKIDSRAGRSNAYAKTRSMSKPKKISELDMSAEIRFSTGIAELDRVLGGGAVVGSLVLVGGAPGIGKSTLLLQMCGCVDSGRKILYVTGEESERQLKLRAVRLGVDNAEIYVLAETDINSIASCIDELEPEIVIIDSIQTVSDANVDSAPGSISQVRECTMRIMRLTKEKGLTVFVVGHINKEGSIAGPKVLEHMVDCVLYFEGERSTSFRLLRAVKNRFGSTNEIGVFEMDEDGLNGVENPSEALLAGRPENAPGTCVACVVEGTRPILAEVQALVTKSGFGTPRRMAASFDYNRLALILAVMEKRCGFYFGNLDVYVNVVGGLRLTEPAADLAVACALYSGLCDKPVGERVMVFGEIGLGGEIRNVNHFSQRINEGARLGFERSIVPKSMLRQLKKAPEGMQILGASNLKQAFSALSKE